MADNQVQMGITLPIGLHEQARQAALKRGATEGRQITISEIYSEAVRSLVRRIDAGEDIVFGAHPRRGGVEPLSVRLDEDAAQGVHRFRDITTQSSFISTAVRHFLQKG